MGWGTASFRSDHPKKGPISVRVGPCSRFQTCRAPTVGGRENLRRCGNTCRPHSPGIALSASTSQMSSRVCLTRLLLTSLRAFRSLGYRKFLRQQLVDTRMAVEDCPLAGLLLVPVMAGLCRLSAGVVLCPFCANFSPTGTGDDSHSDRSQKRF